MNRIAHTMCAESEMHGFVLWLFLDLLKTPLEQVADGQAVYLHGRSRAGKGSKIQNGARE